MNHNEIYQKFGFDNEYDFEESAREGIVSKTRINNVIKALDALDEDGEFRPEPQKEVKQLADKSKLEERSEFYQKWPITEGDFEDFDNEEINEMRLALQAKPKFDTMIGRQVLRGIGFYFNSNEDFWGFVEWAKEKVPSLSEGIHRQIHEHDVQTVERQKPEPMKPNIADDRMSPPDKTQTRSE